MSFLILDIGFCYSRTAAYKKRTIRRYGFCRDHGERDLLQMPKRKTNTFGVNSIVFKGALLCNKLPVAIKMQNQLQ